MSPDLLDPKDTKLGLHTVVHTYSWNSSCLFSILNLPPHSFLFPTHPGSANRLLTPCDHGQLKTSHQPFCFRMANKTYKVNLTSTLTLFNSTADSVIRGKKNQYLWMWPENQNVKMPKAVRLKSRSQCIQSTSQNWPPLWKQLLDTEPKPRS